MWGPVGVHLSSKEQKKKMLLPAPVILTTRAWCQRHIALPPARRSTCARHRPATAAAAQTGAGVPHRDSGRASRLHLHVPHHRPRPPLLQITEASRPQWWPAFHRTAPSASDFLPPAPAPSHRSLRRRLPPSRPRSLARFPPHAVE